MPLNVEGKVYYSIAEGCAMAGTNRGTFLRWVREGKFADVQHRDRNGWRLFTADEVGRLKTRVNHVERVEKVK